VHAEWPIGPVCSHCYTRVRASPAVCPACRCRLPLVGITGLGMAANPLSTMNTRPTASPPAIPANPAPMND
jgi:hypothetical protein